MASHHSVTVLCRELQAMSAANRTGSGTNAQLAKLVTKALADNQGLFEFRHGFILGDHANQFQSELTAVAMKALANELESYYHRIVELERHHNRMRNQGPEVGGWGGGNQPHQLQQSVPGSTSSKRRRRRNTGEIGACPQNVTETSTWGEPSELSGVKQAARCPYNAGEPSWA